MSTNDCRTASYGRDGLLRAARGELFGPDRPRLPSASMLMLDRIRHISDSGGQHGKGEVIGELDIRPDLWFFGCHFQDDPVMPGCLGLDAMWQLLGFYLGWVGGVGKGRALGVDRVRFSGQVLPTAKRVSYHLQVRRVIRRKLMLGVADGVLAVDGRDIYSAVGLQVGLFRDEALEAPPQSGEA